MFILFLLCVHISNQIRPSNFEDFMADPQTKRLLDEFKNKQIRTQKELHERIVQTGIEIRFRTLVRYLSKIKV